LSEIQSIKESVNEAPWDGQRIIGLAETSYKSKIVRNIPDSMESKARHAFSVAGGSSAAALPLTLFQTCFSIFLLNSFNLGSRPTQIILLSLQWRCYAFMKFISDPTSRK
jgi:hypothetical protein